MPSSEAYIIRRLTLKDILEESGFLSVLAQLTTVQTKPLTRELLESRFHSLDPARYHPMVLVRSSDGKVMGAATLLVEEKFIHDCGRVGHIEDVVVSRDLRGGGYGKKLIDCLLSLAKELGCYKVILDCDENNVPFYEKCDMVKKGIQMALYYS
jgi:glucosamine-phosphate N-acetyltransferase